ncbi:MAG: hypothetical protein QMD04_14585 [Anaerolineales bacterium]|nr:hypothetical protein [Anaerolineales bacterium]
MTRLFLHPPQRNQRQRIESTAPRRDRQEANAIEQERKRRIEGTSEAEGRPRKYQSFVDSPIR